MDQKLLGIKIDYVKMYQAIELIQKWMTKRGGHYIVTPNPEMIVDGQFDPNFKRALNSADLSIPDSSRLGWGNYIQSIKNPFLRLIYAPSFLFPHVLPRFSYPKTTGVDLMETVLRLSEEKAFVTAYLGGTNEVADRLFECLKLKYPNLKIAFCAGNIEVNSEGIMRFDTENNKMTLSKPIKSNLKPINKIDAHKLSQKIDILFVAFGHKKQEKWMHENLPKLNTRLMIGVGGAFDYLSGVVPRAPLIMRRLGLEWLFRVVIQPWRIKRFWKLFYFVYMVIAKR